MRTPAIAAAAVLAVVSAGCDNRECVERNDCPLDQVCTVDGRCVVEPGSEPFVCDVAATDDSFLIDPNLGFPRIDTKWSCPLPQVSGGDGPRVTSSVPAELRSVSGISVDLQINIGQLEGFSEGILVYGVEGNGYFARNVTSDSLPSVLDVDLFLKPFARGGEYNIFFGVDPGVGTQNAPKLGNIHRIPIRVFSVGSGDIQVNVAWDTVNDVDLHVVAPNGEHVYFGQDTVPSGGALDLDSNVGCPDPNSEFDKRNENIFWPVGTAPAGEYKIYVDNFSACEPVTNYTVVVSRSLQVVEVVDGSLLDVNDPDPQDFDGIGELVTTVSFPN